MIHVSPVQHIFWMLNLLTDDIKKILKPDKDKKTLIITVGNTLRSDDGIGPYISQNLNKNIDNTIIFDAGNKPENIIDQAVSIKPQKTIIIDAADFKGKTGEIRHIPNEYIPDTTLSTHTFPLKVIAQILKEDTGSEIFFLGIQPKSVGMGEEMSKEVKNTGDAIISFLKK